MKKIGIITLCGNNNYGNKLQNFAICSYLKKNGYEPSTIWVDNACVEDTFSNIKYHLWRTKRDVCDSLSRRRRLFKKFNRYLNVRNCVYSENSLKRISNKYDVFLVGSDQVWNYEYIGKSPIYFLKGIAKKKSSFSASFGVDNIPDQYKTIYKKYLLEFDYISVREERGKELVKELSGRNDAVVLADPTILLDAQDWDSISKKPKSLSCRDKYILCYFLGEPSCDWKKEIDNFAKRKNLKVINILDENSTFYNTGPEEFLYLVKHAEMVCTDSFHSCIFSIVYRRPFIVFDRREKKSAKINSRIDTLLSTFNFNNRRYCGHIDESCLLIGYDDVSSKINEEKRKISNYIQGVLSE